ncbi:MAG: ATP-dependent sacrificial sulfur transferase LarE [Myxococcota bacterium]|nr:ATP-dependent sacrificial sulfur transferase LarE [Myxococcota bacterium]
MSALLPIVQHRAEAGSDPSLVISSSGDWQPKVERLREDLRAGERWVVAFSGGIDSAFLLAVAVQEVGDRVLALTAVSPTLPDEERDDCIEIARRLGARHVFVESSEMDVEGFFTNPVNRCFFCKEELYRVAWEKAVALGVGLVADGVNLDDLGDHRPGHQAAAEASIRHPLVDAGLTKADIRGAARALGMEIWNKPAFACLSSRFPYGTHITPERLTMVGRIEALLKELQFRQYRVRYHDTICRIEVRPADLIRLVSEPVRSQVVNLCHEVGFTYVTLDLQGYRQGALNEGVDEAVPGGEGA